MFMTFLRFSENRAAAPDFAAAHDRWIAQGFAEGKFLCVGALLPGAGGAILPHGESRAALDARIAADPFVRQGIVSAETHAIAPRRTIPALDFLRPSA